MSNVFYPPPLEWHLRIILIVLFMLAMIPVLLKGYRDNMAVREMNKTVERELTFYSSIIREMNDTADRRAWERQFGNRPYLTWEEE